MNYNIKHKECTHYLYNPHTLKTSTEIFMDAFN